MAADLYTADFDIAHLNQRASSDTFGGSWIGSDLNAYIERFVQSIQQECLDKFIAFGREHFDHLIGEYTSYTIMSGRISRKRTSRSSPPPPPY